MLLGLTARWPQVSCLMPQTLTSTTQGLCAHNAKDTAWHTAEVPDVRFSPLSHSAQRHWVPRQPSLEPLSFSNVGFFSFLHSLCPSSNLPVPWLLFCLESTHISERPSRSQNKRLWPTIDTTKESTRLYLDGPFLSGAFSQKGSGLS